MGVNWPGGEAVRFASRRPLRTTLGAWTDRRLHRNRKQGCDAGAGRTHDWSRCIGLGLRHRAWLVPGVRVARARLERVASE